MRQAAPNWPIIPVEELSLVPGRCSGLCSRPVSAQDAF